MPSNSIQSPIVDTEVQSSPGLLYKEHWGSCCRAAGLDPSFIKVVCNCLLKDQEFLARHPVKWAPRDIFLLALLILKQVNGMVLPRAV